MADVVPEQVRIDTTVGDVALVVPLHAFDRTIPAGQVLLSVRTDIEDGVTLDIEDDAELFVL